jgi:hypothetical protein
MTESRAEFYISSENSVNERRRRKNPDKAPIDPKNTVAKARNVEGAMARLKAAGVSTVKLGRAGAEAHIVEMLKQPL